MTQFSDRVCMRRLELEQTQTEAGKQCGVAYSTIGRWENGITVPEVHNLKRLRDWLGISSDKLIDLFEVR